MSAPLKYVDVDPKSRVNKMFTYVLVCMNILSPLFILLNTGSVYFDNQFTISVFFFHYSCMYCISTFICTVSFGV